MSSTNDRRSSGTDTIFDAKGLLLRIFLPAAGFSAAYLLLGLRCPVPHLLLFCILGTVLLVPAELGVMLAAGKKRYGRYTLSVATAGTQKLPAWQIILAAAALFGIAGMVSLFFAPVENRLMSPVRNAVLGMLPPGFDWTDIGYIRSFPKPILIATCVFYLIFNIFIGPVTEELYFRGYLTSHYKKQDNMTPILITALFSLYHFWLPFNNMFRVLAFAPAAFLAYRKKNILISTVFHCACNLFSSVSFIIAVLG